MLKQKKFGWMTRGLVRIWGQNYYNSLNLYFFT